MNCTCCGTELEAGARFCCECGADVPQVKACVKCGVQLPLNAKFCSQCGMRQDGGAAARGGLAMGDKNVVAGDVIGDPHCWPRHHHKECGRDKEDRHMPSVRKHRRCAGWLPVYKVQQLYLS